MSKLPNISSARTSIQNTEIESANNISETPNDERNIILPLLPQENNNIYDMNKTPLLFNSKLTELEAKYFTLEKNYENVLNKITTNEKRIFSLQNSIKTNNNNLTISNKHISSSSEEQDKFDRQFTLLNNKIKYLEEMLKSDQEIRAQENRKN